jgi:hypothetical protein
MDYILAIIQTVATLVCCCVISIIITIVICKIFKIKMK